MDKSLLKEVLANNVGKILPHKSQEELVEIVDFLISEGVKKESDVRHMTIPLLKKVLDTVDSTDLFVEWQNSYGTSTPSTSSSGRSQLPAVNTRQPRQPLQDRNVEAAAATELRNNRLPYFDKDSPYFPSRVRESINKGLRPTASDRNTMVENVIDHCREKVPDFDRSDIPKIAEQIVKLYPKSFKDTMPQNDIGADGLAFQMQTKFDNDNRSLKRTAAEKNRQALNTPQAFGCVNWTCNVPNGETEASLERKQKQLIDIYSKGKRHWDWKKINSDMDLTFCIQRREINGPEEQPTTSKSRKRKRTENDDPADEDTGDSPPGSKKTLLSLKTIWPFLFLPRGMNIHFKQLTGIDFTLKLEDYLREDGKKLINFLSLKGEKFGAIKRKMDKYESRGNLSSPFIALTRLLQQFFKESLEDFVSYVEETTEFDEVEDKAKIPNGQPFLVLAGDSLYECNAVFLFIDSKPVTSTDDFKEALSMWFMSYYVFNLCYTTKLAASLTFIQRAIAGISTRGLKCLSTTIQSGANKKANKLSDQFELYKQKINDDSQHSD